MQKLLVIRNDKLGDFMLIFPALCLLKKAMPQLEITALVPSYTAPMAELCPYIDKIIIDTDHNDKIAIKQLITHIKEQHFDASISFFSSWHNAKLTFLSKIPYRLAPATKIFQYLYNHRLTQRRSQSLKAEFEYNLDLVKYFLQSQNVKIPAIQPPYLTLSLKQTQQQKQFLAQTLNLDIHKKWIFIHSGSGGSATNLNLQQYADLSLALLQQFDCQIILSAGPGESEQAHQLATLISHPKVVIYDKNQGLQDFTASLACADLFVSGSTGPLHVSAALNIPTIGFYPSKRSATPIRWRPINDVNSHLAFCPPKGKETEMNLSLISIPDSLSKIIPFIKNIWKI